MKVVTISETGHGVSTTTDDIEKLQTRIEQHKEFIKKIEPFIVESLPEHPFVEVRQPKPFVKIKKNKNFDPHKFKRR